MIISDIMGTGNVYTCKVYLVTGDWKRIEDVNTLVDVGSDPSIIDVIESMNTGIGKNKVEQVILTHNHSDHTSILPLIRKIYHPVVYAYSPNLQGVDHVLTGGERIRLGDRTFEVIHSQGHSHDSISLFNEEDGAIFTGDMTISIMSPNGTYERQFIDAMRTLSRKRIKAIYPGHGDPIVEGTSEIIKRTLMMIQKSNNSTQDTSQLLDIT